MEIVKAFDDVNTADKALQFSKPFTHASFTLGWYDLSLIHTKTAIHKLKRFTDKFGAKSKMAVPVSLLIHCLIFYSYNATENICQHQLTLWHNFKNIVT